MASVAVALALVLCTPASATTVADQTADPVAAESYAAEFRVSLAEANRRLGLQDQLRQLRIRLAEIGGPRFAGAWLEHVPEFRIVVRFVGKSPVEAATVLASSAPIPVRIELGADRTYDELLAGLRRLEELLAVERPSARLALDVQQAQVVVTTSSQIDAATVERYGAVAQVSVATAIEYGEGERLVGATYGGMRIRFQGSSSYTLCTTGFTVQGGSGELGVTSAAHCGDDVGSFSNITYSDLKNNTSYRVYYKNKVNDADQDIVWASETLHPVFARFWIGGSLRDVTGIAYSGMLGDWVCHYGITTGNSCGSVVNEWFDPGNKCGVSGTDNCAAEWIKVAGSQLACYGGDSGGPLYHNEIAYGTLQAGYFSGNQKGQCIWASFMRMDHFIALPLLAN